MQLTHYNSRFKQRSFPIVLVCENVTNAANVGSLFRTADAFGVEKLVFCGSPIPLGRKMTKTSRATEKHVNHEYHEEIVDVLKELKAMNYQLIALEISSNSTALSQMNFESSDAVALVIGDENSGVSETSLALADFVVHIDMFGHNSSMNVVQATSITLYEITKQLL